MGQQVRTFKGKRSEISVRKIGEWEYEATSESRDGEWYRVVLVLNRWLCGCKGFAHTNRACKHIAAMKKLYSPSPTPAPRCRKRRKARRRNVIGMPTIKCHHCRSTKFRTSHVRGNKLGDVQVYRCLNRECGRRFTPKDGFWGMTYRGGYVVPALEDKASCKRNHDIRDSLGKLGQKPARSTLYTWFRRFPVECTPYLVSLDYGLSETAYADEIVRRIGGAKSVIFSMMDGGTRMFTAYQIGRFKGSHNVDGMVRMDTMIRGTAPSIVRTDAANNFDGAFKREILNNKEGKPVMHIRHVHLTGDINTNPKERDNDTLSDFVKSCRGLKSMDTAYIGLYQIHFNAVRSHMGIGGLRPMEAAGVWFEHPNKWLAVIQNAADYNNAVKLGIIKPTKAVSPHLSGFQAK